jgi:Acetyltransferase (GNAT) domain
MINYLQHIQIDKNQWNECISRSLNRRVYAYSWYLDLVCPGWDALVEDNYTRVFPLTHRQKWGITYLFQPYFTQQLGIFSPDDMTENHVIEFIRAIPHRFRFVEIHLNSMNRFQGGEGETTMCVNHELELAPPYEALAAKYSQNTRRNLRKAEGSGITLTRNIGVDDLISLFRDNFGKKEGKLVDIHYATLRRLIIHGLEHHSGYILAAITDIQSLAAGAFFLYDQQRVYFLFAASAPEARENGAMFFLIDRFIAENAGKEMILDFEGGNDSNLGRFYQSFGAVKVPYPALLINRLSKVTKKGLYFIRKLRK